MRRAPVVTARVLAVIGSAAPAAALAGAQTFPTALPVGAGDAVLREQLVYRSAGDDPRPANRDARAWGAITTLAYGITPELTLFGVVPVVGKRLTATTPGGRRVERGSAGLGDARLFARYTAYRSDDVGRTVRIAPFAGVELPTGADGARDRLGRLPQPLQPGSGSWDPFAGVVATWQTLAYEVDAQLAYKANTAANGFAFGDVARADASLQYRVRPDTLSAGAPAFLYTTLGFNLIHRRQNAVAGAADPPSGGTQVFLAPGLQYVTTRWVLEGVVQVPVAQDLNAAGLKDEVIVRAGVRLRF